MNDFLQILGVLTLCIGGAALVFGAVWLVIQVCLSRDSIEQHHKENYTSNNHLSDRIWTEHHRVSAIETELIKYKTDIHNLTVNMRDRDKIGTQFMADLKSLQHQMDVHRKYRHADDEAKEQEPSSRV